MEIESSGLRRKRKEEAKLLKRQRIEQSGGVRPRKDAPDNDANPATGRGLPGRTKTVSSPQNRPSGQKSERNERSSVSDRSSGHRFGRVMETVPCRNQPRLSTVSIAIPGSVVANCQTRELKTQISGQIARAATIYHVDEIIVFDDKLSKNDARRPFFRQSHGNDTKRCIGSDADGTVEPSNEFSEKSGPRCEPDEATRPHRSSDPHTFLARLLQYCECPQYLRRHFFPMHPDLQFAGLLAPVDTPHHVRADDRCPFREGVVLDKHSSNKGSLVNCGIRGRPVQYVQCVCCARCLVQHSNGRWKGM
jgi:Putative RNA methyltransferase